VAAEYKTRKRKKKTITLTPTLNLTLTLSPKKVKICVTLNFIFFSIFFRFRILYAAAVSIAVDLMAVIEIKNIKNKLTLLKYFLIIFRINPFNPQNSTFSGSNINLYIDSSSKLKKNETEYFQLYLII
jgi:hypothetical protein